MSQGADVQKHFCFKELMSELNTATNADVSLANNCTPGLFQGLPSLEVGLSI